jgi:RNA polymerase sigma factor (sigma-70 family)
MAALQPHAVLRHLCRLVAQQQPDAELLGRFVAGGDEAAFAALVRRHGPLVLSVCRSVLRHEQDAEDVFQATFLVLARKAGSVRKQAALGSWLHGVAYRLARRAQARAAHQAVHERQVRDGTASPAPMDDLTWRELRGALHEEVERLPAKHGLPLLLCYWEGLTQEEAAQRLDLPKETLKNRLERARQMLRSRLVRRGLAPAVPLLAAGLSSGAVSASLVETTTRGALLFAAGGAVSGPALVLADGAVRAIGLVKLKMAAALLLVVSVAAAGAGLTATELLREDPPQPKQAEAPKPSPVPDPRRDVARTDRFGDPLPEGALARLGTMRCRHEGEATYLAFSADGKMLAATNRDGTILLFDTATGKRLHQIRPEDAPFGIGPLAFSADGKYLAFQTREGTVQLWDPATKQHVRTLTAQEGDKGPTSSLFQMRFSPDGKRLAAAAGGDRTVVWDVGSGKEIATLRGHNHANPPLAFSPDGKMIAVSSKPIVQLYDAQTGKLLRAFNTDQEWAITLAFSMDGKTIATGVRNRIILSDVDSGKETARLSLSNIRDGGGVMNLAFTPDGKTLVCSAEEARVIVWDLATRTERFVLDSRGWIGRSMALSPDGKTVALGTVYNVIRLWDVATGKEHFVEPEDHDAPVHAVAYSPDGKLLATGGENQQVHLWDAASGRHRGQLQGQSAKALSFSPDGKYLAAGWMWKPTARVWDVATGEEVLKVTHDESRGVHGIAFAQDGKALLSLVQLGQGNAGSVNTWETATGKRLRQVLLPLQPECLALAPDAKLAVVGGRNDPPILLYDVDHGKERARVPSDQVVVVSATFSPDGRIFATGGVDRTVGLWETASRLPIATLRGHDRSVAAVAFSPDGRVLASADGGPQSRFWQAQQFPLPPQKIHLWDVVSGEQLALLEGHESDVTALAFSPGGQRLVSGLANGTVLIWDVAARTTIPMPAVAELGEKEVDALWADLASADAAKALRAVRKLARSPAAVPQLRTRLQPAEVVGPERLAALIADLDSEQFATREQASKELQRIGEPARPALRQALARDPSLEVRRRIEALLDQLDGSPDTWRWDRAVQTLEYAGTKEAEQLLARLSQGASEARLTREAKAALKRLARRPAPSP